MKEIYQKRSLTLFDNNYVLPLTSASIPSIEIPSVILFYDSESKEFASLKRMFEFVSKLTSSQDMNICYYAMDCRAYPDIVKRFTNVTPRIYLYLHGIPIIYHGSYHLGEIHLWLKLQISTCSIQASSSPTSVSPVSMSPGSVSPASVSPFSMSPIFVSPSPPMYVTPMPSGFPMPTSFQYDSFYPLSMLK